MKNNALANQEWEKMNIMKKINCYKPISGRLDNYENIEEFQQKVSYAKLGLKVFLGTPKSYSIDKKRLITEEKIKRAEGDMYGSQIE